VWLQFWNQRPVVLIKLDTKYTDKITLSFLSIICSYIDYTTTRFGQIVQPSSGSLEIHRKEV